MCSPPFRSHAHNTNNIAIAPNAAPYTDARPSGVKEGLIPISCRFNPISVNCPVRAAITASHAATPASSGSVEAKPGNDSDTRPGWTR